MMDIQDNSVVTDVDTEILDGEITQISNDFSETYYLDGEQEEELEMLVAKAMKLGELYERKKWQAAKAQAVPEVITIGNELQSWVAVNYSLLMMVRVSYLLSMQTPLLQKLKN